LETDAFDAILGLDFLSCNPSCGGILTQPPPERLIFDGKEFVLNHFQNGKEKASQVFHVHKAFKTEAYTLVPSVKQDALDFLGLEGEFSCDLFANQMNAQHKPYCTRANSAFWYNWSKLCDFGGNILWANPPFSQLDRVLAKVVQNPCKIVLVTPNWPGRPWRSVLDKIAVKQYFVPPGQAPYETDRNKKCYQHQCGK